MKKLLLIIFMGSAFFACKKDDPTTKGTPMERLTSDKGEKTWKLVSGRAFGANGAEIDLIQNNPCLADNQLILRSDLTYTLNDTGEKCSATDSINDKWVFTETPLQIRLAQISLLGRNFNNVVLDLTNLTTTTFSGDMLSVPENTFGINKISLTFEVLK